MNKSLSNILAIAVLAILVIFAFVHWQSRVQTLINETDSTEGLLEKISQTAPTAGAASNNQPLASE